MIKASLKRIDRCVDCSFVWSMTIGKGETNFFCVEMGKELKKPMLIPDECPLPNFDEMVKKHLPNSYKEMDK